LLVFRTPTHGQYEDLAGDDNGARANGRHRTVSYDPRMARSFPDVPHVEGMKGFAQQVHRLRSQFQLGRTQGFGVVGGRPFRDHLSPSRASGQSALRALCRRAAAMVVRQR
jgi:hypothetical protein